MGLMFPLEVASDMRSFKTSARGKYDDLMQDLVKTEILQQR